MSCLLVAYPVAHPTHVLFTQRSTVWHLLQLSTHLPVVHLQPADGALRRHLNADKALSACNLILGTHVHLSHLHVISQRLTGCHLHCADGGEPDGATLLSVKPFCLLPSGCSLLCLQLVSLTYMCVDDCVTCVSLWLTLCTCSMQNPCSDVYRHEPQRSELWNICGACWLVVLHCPTNTGLSTCLTPSDQDALKGCDKQSIALLKRRLTYSHSTHNCLTGFLRLWPAEQVGLPLLVGWRAGDI